MHTQRFFGQDVSQQGKASHQIVIVPNEAQLHHSICQGDIRHNL